MTCCLWCTSKVLAKYVKNKNNDLMPVVLQLGPPPLAWPHQQYRTPPFTHPYVCVCGGAYASVRVRTSLCHVHKCMSS
jgi:hypothetical protein